MSEWWQEGLIPSGITGVVAIAVAYIGKRVDGWVKARDERNRVTSEVREVTNYCHALRRDYAERAAEWLIRDARWEAAVRELDPDHPLLSEPHLPYPKPLDWPKGLAP